jgi:hypothetical protein
MSPILAAWLYDVKVILGHDDEPFGQKLFTKKLFCVINIHRTIIRAMHFSGGVV